MGLTDLMKSAGFKPKANVDEDFPPIKGEYKAKWAVMRPFEDKDSKEKTAYLATWKIEQTLDGDMADGRMMSRFYRIGGKDFNGKAIEDGAKAEALKSLCNDAQTVGVELDLSSDEAFEKSFAKLIDKPAFIRAWTFSPKAEPDRTVQQFVIKQEKHLRKGSKKTAAGKSDKAPF